MRAHKAKSSDYRGHLSRGNDPAGEAYACGKRAALALELLIGNGMLSTCTAHSSRHAPRRPAPISARCWSSPGGPWMPTPQTLSA
jgi:hypothetical protein